MNEADLIEISRRFRMLEDAVDDPRLLLADRDDPRYQKARAEREAALDICRDDLVAMQEALRKSRTS